MDGSACEEGRLPKINNLKEETQLNVKKNNSGGRWKTNELVNFYGGKILPFGGSAKGYGGGGGALNRIGHKLIADF